MSDTLDFLSTSPEATVSTDIDLDVLGANLENLSDEELNDIAKELGLSKATPDTTAKEAITGYLAEQNGTANVTDITHNVAQTPSRTPDFLDPAGDSNRASQEVQNPVDAPETAGGPEPTLVDELPEIDNTIVTVSRRWWMNPFTGNRVPHGQRDVDGMGNVNGKAVHVPAPNPIAPPPVYDDE